MNLRFLHSKIGKNYGWELNTFYKYRDFKDGIDFFIIDASFDKYHCDHKPSFQFAIKILNVMVIDFSIYNLWHVDNPNSPYYGLDDDDDAPDYEKDNHE